MSWVHPPSAVDAHAASFRFDVDVDSFAFSAATLAVLTPDDLLERTFGQLLGESVPVDPDTNQQPLLDRLVAGLKCASPALHAFNLTSLSAAIGAIQDPTLSAFVPVDPGLEALVNNVANPLMRVLRGALAVQMDDIMQHFVRHKVNSLIGERILGAAAGDCAEPLPPAPPVNTDNYIDFGTSPAFKVVETAVAKVLGGDPILDTSANFNEVVQLLVEWALERFEVPASRVTSPVDGTWVVTPDAVFTQTTPEFAFELVELRIENLNSMYVLELEGGRPTLGAFAHRDW